MPEKKEIEFPVGYYDFNPISHINFELNRWYSLGCSNYEDMKEIGARITNFSDWRKELLVLAEKAVSTKQLLYAAFYNRALEFFSKSTDPEKERFYDLFIKYFNEYYADDNIKRYNIPYNNGYLPAICIEPNGNKKGTIVIHGGFDSFIEEFYQVAKYLEGKTQQEIILFDGPGQGGALHKYGLTLINEWEKPVGEILNYFKLEDVTLIGVSLGGYLCIRAAAFEPRISRVVCYDAYYDFEGQLLGRAPLIKKLLIKFMMKTNRAKKYNKLIDEAIQNNLQLDWGMDHMSYVTGKTTHFEGTKYMLTFSAKKISSKITQDVLLFAGEDDHLVPMQMFKKQKNALKNARSITSRIFTVEENASAHCQVGNLPLALNYIADWINSKI